MAAKTKRYRQLRAGEIIRKGDLVNWVAPRWQSAAPAAGSIGQAVSNDKSRYAFRRVKARKKAGVK